MADDRKELKNISLHSDTYVLDSPLKTPDPQLDKLIRYPFAKRVAETIASLQDPSSIVIGIHGAWGEGKTSILNFIEFRLKELEKDDNPVILFWFNPWRFQDEANLLLSFFQTMADALKRPPTSTTEKLSSRLSSLADSLLRYSEILSLISIPIGPIQIKPGDLAKVLKENRSSISLDDLKKNIEKSCEAIKIRIVVFMDDIDRLDISEIQMLFKLVKLTANFPYTAYILAFDEKRVASALDDVYPTAGANSTEGTSAGQVFLEKIIQVPLQVPQPNRLSLAILCIEGMKQVLNANQVDFTEEEWDQFQSHFVSGLLESIKTPRMVTRYRNTVAFALPLLKDEVSWIDLALVEGIRVFYPRLYSIINNNKAVFLGTLLSASVYDEETKKKTLEYCNDIVETGLSTYPDAQKKSARNLLSALFPALSPVFGGAYFAFQRDQDRWMTEKRISSNEYFERYFSYAVPLFDVPDKEVDEFILSHGDATSTELSSKMSSLLATANVTDVIRKLAYRIRALSDKQRLSVGTLQVLAVSLSRFGSIAPESGSVYSNPAADLVFYVLKLIQDVQIKLDLARIIAERIEPITFVFECFKLTCRPTGEARDDTFLEEEQNELCQILVGRIRQLSTVQNLYVRYPKYAPYFLKAWAAYGSREETNAYLKSTLDKKPQNVFDLIKSCLQGGREERELLPYDLEITTWTHYDDLITAVVDAEIIHDALLRINPNVDSETSITKRYDSYQEEISHQFARFYLAAKKQKSSS